MSTGAVVAGQLSPDGRWRWDGAQWVPVVPGAAPMRPPGSTRAWIWWLVGGCAVLLVLGTIGVGFGVYMLVTRFQQGAFSCLPSDFPSYPGASVVSENTSVGVDLPPGDTHECTMVLESNDDVGAVIGFYEQNMAAGDWTISGSFAPDGGFSFQRKSKPTTTGALYVSARGQRTQLEIHLYS